MPADKILTFDDYQDEAHHPLALPRSVRSYASYLEHFSRLHGQTQPAVPDTITNQVQAVVDAGRWLWSCGGCLSAMPVATATDPTICVSCGGLGWATVVFPANRDEIESELLKQPGHRYLAPVRHWRPSMTLADLQERTAKANELLRANPNGLIRALSIGLPRVWMVGESLSATNMNLYISSILSDLSGDSGLVEFRDSIQASSIIAPGGTTLQRPAAAQGRLRWNTTDGTFDLGQSGGWGQMLNSGAVTFANLSASNSVGTGSNQVAQGDHTHVANTREIVRQSIDSSSSSRLLLQTGTNWADVYSFTLTNNGSALVVLWWFSQTRSGTNAFVRLIRGGNLVSVADLGDLPLSSGGGENDVSYWIASGNGTYTLQSRSTSGVGWTSGNRAIGLLVQEFSVS